LRKFAISCIVPIKPNMHSSFFLLVVPAAACSGKPGEPHALVNPESGKCLDVFNPDGLTPSQYRDETQVNIFRCNKAKGQEWNLQDGQLINTASGKCLDIANPANLTADKYQDETKVQLVQCTRKDNQQWAFVDQGPGHTQIVNLPSGKCLDIYSPAGYLEDNTGVQLFACDTDKPNQKWVFEDVPQEDMECKSNPAIGQPEKHNPICLKITDEIQCKGQLTAKNNSTCVWEPKNSTMPDGNSTNPDGNSTNPDGNSTNPDGNSTNPDGNSTNPDGNSTKPDGNDGNSTKPNDDGNNNKPDDQPSHDNGLQFDDPKVQHIIEEMKSFVSDKGGKPTAVDFLLELRTKQATYAFDERVRLFISISTLCGNSLDQQELMIWREHITEVITKGGAGALAGSDVLWVFDAIMKVNPVATQDFSMVLRTVYEVNWCSEHVMLAHYRRNHGKGPGFENAKEKGAEFINWLEETSTKEEKVHRFDDQEIHDVISDMTGFVGTKGRNLSAIDFQVELRAKQATVGFDDRMRLFVSVSSLCGSKLNLQELTLWKTHINEVIVKGKNGTLSGRSVLWAFDAYIEANPRVPDNDFSMVLKTIYEDNWCTKETMLTYYGRTSGAEPGFLMAKKKAAAFLSWLDEQTKKDNHVPRYDDAQVVNLIGEMKQFVSHKSGKPSAPDFLAELRKRANQTCSCERFGGKIRLFIALSTLCGDKLNQKELMLWKGHISEVIDDDKDGVLPGSDVLWVFDAYLEAFPGTANVFPMVLQMIHEQSWCSQEDILAHYNQNLGKGEPGFGLAKDKAAPFLEWLEGSDETNITDGNQTNTESSDQEKPGQDKPRFDAPVMV